VRLMSMGFNILREPSIFEKNSYGFWDNQWFGRNQIYLKLKLGARQFMPGIKNWNFFELKKKIIIILNKKISE
jgi:hypothetical protein